MQQMWCFSMLSGREKFLPKKPLINKEYKSFNFNINSYLV